MSVCHRVLCGPVSHPVVVHPSPGCYPVLERMLSHYCVHVGGLTDTGRAHVVTEHEG